jgi:DNA-directed RNA polymerase subunit alpha
MENLLLPSKIEFLDGDEPNKGSLVVSPCYHGYGTTLGNAIRRVLLSSLPGSAAESFKIKGVQHEFGAVEGVKEDVVEIMLNLKQLVVRVYSDEPVTLNLIKKGKGTVTAGDFEKNANVEIINKDLVIANLTSDNKEFNLEVEAGKGRGFVTSEQKTRDNLDLGTIVIDSIYTPVRDVGYNVEYTRVGDITNYEKLSVNIETNGIITPKEAAIQSVQILMDHFGVVLNGISSNMAKELPVLEVTAEEVIEEKPKKVKVQKEKVEKPEKIKKEKKSKK